MNPQTNATSARRHAGTGHLKALDGVRGLAILMVVFSHLFEVNFGSRGGAVWLMGQFLYYGSFGVDVFFVLSGFLITGILFDSLGEERYFRKFYARRALRIFPLYYGVLLALILLTPVLQFHWGPMLWLLLVYLQNFRPVELCSYGIGHGVMLLHFWSLAIEEQFYLVWPAVIFALRTRRRILLTTLYGSLGALLLRCVLIGAGVNGLKIHVNTICRADSLLLGGLLAMLYRSEHREQVLRWAPAGFLAAGSVIFASVCLVAPEDMSRVPLLVYWFVGLRYTVLAVTSACLLAWSLRPGTAMKWAFERKWLGFFGKYSYGLYILHFPELVFLPRLRAFLFHETGSKLVSVGLGGLVGLAVATATAYLSFHLYEKRFLRLKRYFDYTPLPVVAPELAPVGTALPG